MAHTSMTVLIVCTTDTQCRLRYSGDSGDEKDMVSVIRYDRLLENLLSSFNSSRCLMLNSLALSEGFVYGSVCFRCFGVRLS